LGLGEFVDEVLSARIVVRPGLLRVNGVARVLDLSTAAKDDGHKRSYNPKDPFRVLSGYRIITNSHYTARELGEIFILSEKNGDDIFILDKPALVKLQHLAYATFRFLANAADFRISENYPSGEMFGLASNLVNHIGHLLTKIPPWDLVNRVAFLPRYYLTTKEMVMYEDPRLAKYGLNWDDFGVKERMDAFIGDEKVKCIGSMRFSEIFDSSIARSHEKLGTPLFCPNSGPS